MAETKLRRVDKNEVAASLYAGVSKVANRLRTIELPKGFTPERLRTLATIHAHGPITVTALAEKERVRPATISRMIASLEEDGLIRRRDDRFDKRSVLVSTTSKGRQMYQRASQEYLKHISDALNGLEPDQAELLLNLASLLEDLSTALDR